MVRDTVFMARLSLSIQINLQELNLDAEFSLLDARDAIQKLQVAADVAAICSE